MHRILLVAAPLIALACAPEPTGQGSNNPPGGGTTSQPSDHTIVRDRTATVVYEWGYSFNLPERAEVSYDVTTPNGDYFGVAIFSPAQWVSFQNGTGDQATCCVNENDTVVSDSGTLNAGEWYLGFWCNNQVYNCEVRFDISAYY